MADIGKRVCTTQKQQYGIRHIMVLTTLVAMYSGTLKSMTEEPSLWNQLKALLLITVAALVSLTITKICRRRYGMLFGAIMISITTWNLDFCYATFATVPETVEALAACAMMGLIIAGAANGAPWLLFVVAERCGWRKAESETLANERADRIRKVLRLARQHRD